jgi:hypothetical protein
VPSAHSHKAAMARNSNPAASQNRGFSSCSHREGSTGTRRTTDWMTTCETVGRVAGVCVCGGGGAEGGRRS